MIPHLFRFVCRALARHSLTAWFDRFRPLTVCLGAVTLRCRRLEPRHVIETRPALGRDAGKVKQWIGPNRKWASRRWALAASAEFTNSVTSRAGAAPHVSAEHVCAAAAAAILESAPLPPHCATRHSRIAIAFSSTIERAPNTRC
ncbi:hypothetical protein ACJJTC_010809 [Scirpophaga incertulas]